MINSKSPREIEAIVQDYFNNPIACLAFGIDYFQREERDREIIYEYVKRIYLKEAKEKKYETTSN